MGKKQNDEIKRRLDKKDKEINVLNSKFQKIQYEKDSIQDIKATAPEVGFELEFVDSTLFIIVKFFNDVPIEFKPWDLIWDIKSGNNCSTVFFDILY